MKKKKRNAKKKEKKIVRNETKQKKKKIKEKTYRNETKWKVRKPVGNTNEIKFYIIYVVAARREELSGGHQKRTVIWRPLEGLSGGP